MKHLITLFFAVAAFSFTSFAGDVEGRMKVNTKTSTVAWEGGKVTGSTHGGTIAIKNGSIAVEKGRIVTANVSVDMLTMVCTDEMDDDSKNNLIGHLSSPDFFNVKEHSTAFFTLTRFAENKDGSYQVHGKLTIKGVTQDISFPAQVAMGEDSIVIDADLTFDRAKFDIRYGSGSFFDDLGDNMIKDEVAIKLHIEAAI